MFRPLPEATWFRAVPIRLIASVLVILAFAISVLLLFSLEHEQSIVHGLTEGKAVPTQLFPVLWQSRMDLIAITVLLFLVSAIAIGAVITALHYDNTRRTLEEVKGLARHILESIPTGVLTINGNGLITAVNPAAEGVLKRSTTAMLGNNYETVFQEGDTIRMVLDAARQRRQHIDHQDLPYDDGDLNRTRRTIRVSTAELSDDEAGLGGVILLAKDVSDWLALEQRVRGAEKLTALHTLSAGVAHELRNPLSAVDLNLQLLEEELREKNRLTTTTTQYLKVLNAETRRLTAILDNFMKFARPGSLRFHLFDINGVIAHIASLLQHEADERRVRLHMTIAEEMPAIVGDETQISQALLNVVVNAFQAMPDGGVVEITAAPVRIDGKAWVEMIVRDTGVGIKGENVSRLFEPFFTTKVNGSGLGLAIAYRILQDHGGEIKVSSTQGSGTSVVIKLPASLERSMVTLSQ
jgi:signal transduction histidine kinase